LIITRKLESDKMLDFYIEIIKYRQVEKIQTH